MWRTKLRNCSGQGEGRQGGKAQVSRDISELNEEEMKEGSMMYPVRVKSKVYERNVSNWAY